MKLRANSPCSYWSQAKYSIYRSFMICIYSHIMARDSFSRTLSFLASPGRGFRVVMVRQPSHGRPCAKQRGHQLQEARLCLPRAGSILKISTRNARHEEVRCLCHTQSASPRFSHRRLKGHSRLWKAVTNYFFALCLSGFHLTNFLGTIYGFLQIY